MSKKTLVERGGPQPAQAQAAVQVFTQPRTHSHLRIRIRLRLHLQPRLLQTKKIARTQGSQWLASRSHWLKHLQLLQQKQRLRQARGEN